MVYLLSSMDQVQDRGPLGLTEPSRLDPPVTFDPGSELDLFC